MVTDAMRPKDLASSSFDCFPLIVKMRVVWGLDITAIANSLGISRSTVERDWRFAKAWLADEVDQMDH